MSNITFQHKERDYLQVLSFTDTLPFKFFFPTFLLITPPQQKKKDLYLSTALHPFFTSLDLVSLGLSFNLKWCILKQIIILLLKPQKVLLQCLLKKD